jgi:hypothetical protein
MKATTIFRGTLAGLMLLIAVHGGAVGQTVQLGSFTSGTSFYINAKPSADFEGSYLTSVVFAIRWLNSYGVSLGTVTTSYGLAKAGTETVSGAYRYQKFYQSIIPITTHWAANGEYQIMVIAVGQTGAGTGIFEIADIGAVPDGDPYLEIDGADVTNYETPLYRPSTTVPLPVELTSFIATADERGVVLAWKTATETNNAGFDIERSMPGAKNGAKVWAAVGHVEGSGTSNAPKDYAFRNKNVMSGTYAYRLKQIDRDGKFTYSPAVEAVVGPPKEFSLSQNYPNPFNPATTINYGLAEDSRVSMKVYDITGREVASLIDGTVVAGSYAVPLDARSLASGVYFYRLTAAHGKATFTETKRFMLLK